MAQRRGSATRCSWAAANADDAPGAPNLNLTPEEKRVYGQLFRLADSENVGVVTGEVAVKFFEKTRLDSRVLGEVSLALENGPMPLWNR
jgi:DNA replication initiation complex subunit (GINS family)